MGETEHKAYSTSQVAKANGIHPNTVRLYEKIGFITSPRRKANGYRVFTEEHLLQVRVIRLSLQVEIVQNNLRKEALEIIKTMAQGDYEGAIRLTRERLMHIARDQRAAEEAIATVHNLFDGKKPEEDGMFLTRAAAAESLATTIDCLRNWEMNGLFSAKRKQNGYRVYSGEDINRLRIIKILRDANYSISSIHRLFAQIDRGHKVSIRQVLDTPAEDEDILSVCDKLLTSLFLAQDNSYRMIELLVKLKNMHKQTLHFDTRV